MERDRPDCGAPSKKAGFGNAKTYEQAKTVADSHSNLKAKARMSVERHIEHTSAQHISPQQDIKCTWSHKF